MENLISIRKFKYIRENKVEPDYLLLNKEDYLKITKSLTKTSLYHDEEKSAPLESMRYMGMNVIIVDGHGKPSFGVNTENKPKFGSFGVEKIDLKEMRKLTETLTKSLWQKTVGGGGIENQECDYVIYDEGHDSDVIDFCIGAKNSWQLIIHTLEQAKEIIEDKSSSEAQSKYLKEAFLKSFVD